jgi:UDP-glucose 4-epimerase
VAGATEQSGEAHYPETHLIPRILEVASGRRPHLELYGTDYPTPDGTAIRDYIHVLDVAEAHLAALDHIGQGRRSITWGTAAHARCGRCWPALRR